MRKTLKTFIFSYRSLATVLLSIALVSMLLLMNTYLAQLTMEGNGDIITRADRNFAAAIITQVLVTFILVILIIDRFYYTWQTVHPSVSMDSDMRGGGTNIHAPESKVVINKENSEIPEHYFEKREPDAGVTKEEAVRDGEQSQKENKTEDGQ